MRAWRGRGYASLAAFPLRGDIGRADRGLRATHFAISPFIAGLPLVRRATVCSQGYRPAPRDKGSPLIYPKTGACMVEPLAGRYRQSR